MSADASLRIVWPDQERIFRLRLGEIRELQEKQNVGLYALAKRLREGDWRVDDVRETLRLGLIGGGLTPGRAYQVVERYAGPGQFEAAALVAWSVVEVAVRGDPHDEIKKKLEMLLAMDETPSPSASSSPASTDQVPSWDGTPDASINSHSMNSRQP